MLIAERFGLNHETKSDANGRYIRVYKGLNTLLEGTEVRRRSVASPGSNNALSGSVGGSQTMRYGSVSQGRSRPVSMLYPESMSMGGIGSPPPQQHSHQQHYQQQQRMNSYHQPQSYQQYHDSTRVRSFTHSQAGAMAQFSGVMQQYQQQPQPQQQQQYQTTQPFPRTTDNPSRTSGNYVGYPSRLYQDSVVVPSRHPRGPDMTQNFVARQQMHAQEERQAQRQVQLKVLQQIRQRRQSSAGEDGAPAPAATTTTPPPPAQIIMPSPASNGGGSSSSTSGASVFKIEKPGSKAIPIVRPKDEDVVADNGNEQQMASPVSSSSLAQAATDSLKAPVSSAAGATAAAGQQYQE
ncbi:hypothetical protein GGH99_004660 [Coemansia sp. RSA 1285]|nr:hypothetical protein GGH99_004660 [Coemansia sp. RSA 1285]